MFFCYTNFVRLSIPSCHIRLISTCLTLLKCVYLNLTKDLYVKQDCDFEQHFSNILSPLLLLETAAILITDTFCFYVCLCFSFALLNCFLIPFGIRYSARDLNTHISFVLLSFSWPLTLARQSLVRVALQAKSGIRSSLFLRSLITVTFPSNRPGRELQHLFKY